MRYELSKNSPAPDVIRHLRRTLTLRQVGFTPGLRRHERLLMQVTQEHVGASHVYVIGHLLDASDPAYISTEVRIRLLDEARKMQLTSKLLMPHEKTCFISGETNIEDWHLCVHYAEEQTDKILNYTFLYRNQRWFWIGKSEIWRHDSRPNQHLNMSIHGDMIFDETRHFRRQEDILIGIPMISALLLLQKHDVVVREPAPWWPGNEPSKLNVFQTPNPSVSLVRINTSRMIIRPPCDDDGSGCTLRPHDRRSHLRRRGGKIIMVREAKIHGGSGAAVAKVVKIANPL